MRNVSPTRIHGQESFLLKTRTVELAITQTGAMLAPVTFFPQDAHPIRPYAVAPWARETLPPDIPSMLVTLRGDWFCSTFGGNEEPYEGKQLPPHGETANLKWQLLDGAMSDDGAWLRLGLDLSLQGGRCEATTSLVEGQSVIYQRHDLSRLTGPINPGHHATLAFPDAEGAGHLSFSRFIHAQTLFEPLEWPSNRGSSCLKSDTVIADLHAVPCTDGSITDLMRYPARRGFEDLAIVCADPALDFAWSAVTFPAQGYVWFSLRNPRQLASTVLWFSNGGRTYPPWNGRHMNVMGIEDVTAFFHVGLAASCRANPLSRRGIRTYLEPDARGRLSIPYIQGVARIPAGFDRVAAIERDSANRGIILHADAGAAAEVRCETGFLETGRLPALGD